MGEKKRARKQLEHDLFLGAVMFIGAELGKQLTSKAITKPRPVKRPEPVNKSDWQDPVILESTVKKP